MLQVSLLGPLEVRRDGELTRVPGGKTSEVLVRLALDAGVVVRTERLVEDLWADGAGGSVTTRRNTLQSKVAKLRRALGGPPVVVSGDGGYRLTVDPSAVDALAVVEEAAAAARLLEAGAGRDAADLCAAALARFRGDVLPAAGEEEWALPHRARLEAARLSLVGTRLSALVQLGDFADAIG